jgi:hypothetical protein
MSSPLIVSSTFASSGGGNISDTGNGPVRIDYRCTRVSSSLFDCSNDGKSARRTAYKDDDPAPGQVNVMDSGFWSTLTCPGRCEAEELCSHL